MRTYSLVVIALLLAVQAASAQMPPGQQVPPGNPPQAAPGAERLDQYLLRWEQEMMRVQSLAATLKRTEKDPTINQQRLYEGYAQYMKVGSGPSALNMAMLQMSPPGKPNDIAEKFVCTGTYLYQFVPSTKVIRYYELPKPQQGNVADDNFLSFLFGMKAAEAKKRYILELAGEDQWYVHIKVQPRFQTDKADFTAAQIALYKDSFLPAQLWFKQVDGSEVTWQIPAIRSGVQLKREAFEAPQLPPGWKLEQVPRGQPSPPSVIRSGN
jgi:TIGR03009 family protein